MVTKKHWSEFRETGLLLIINQLLHVFGWSIVYEYDDKTDEIVNVYPARVKFRGFNSESTSENYIKISKYMKENAEELDKEVNV